MSVRAHPFCSIDSLITSKKHDSFADCPPEQIEQFSVTEHLTAAGVLRKWRPGTPSPYKVRGVQGGRR
jgi:hypothetical protein